jgi:hypothetical protein
VIRPPSFRRDFWRNSARSPCASSSIGASFCSEPVNRLPLRVEPPVVTRPPRRRPPRIRARPEASRSTLAKILQGLVDVLVGTAVSFGLDLQPK